MHHSIPRIIPCLLAFHVIVATAVAQPELVSGRNPALEPPLSGGGDSGASLISDDGTFVVFASTANNLVLTSSNTPFAAYAPAKFNVFVRNRTNHTTRLVTVNLAGTAGGNGDSFPVALSSDGENVLIRTSANDLLPGDTNDCDDLVLCNLQSGSRTLIAVTTNGGFSSNAPVEAAMTPDAKYVAFVSAAGDLVDGDTNEMADVFIRDVAAGATIWVTPGSQPPASGYYEYPSSFVALRITPDGRFVGFISPALGVAPTTSTNTGNAYLHDAWNGTTECVSERINHDPSWGCSDILVSDDHRFVVIKIIEGSQPYTHSLHWYSADTGEFVRIRDTLVRTNIPRRSISGESHVDMTPDGRFVAYVGDNDTSVYLWDAQSGSNHLVTVRSDNTNVWQSCQSPCVSADGRFVAFLSQGEGLTTNVVTSGDFHLYVRDMLNETTELVDVSANGTGITQTMFGGPNMTPDGRIILFDGSDADLVPLDRNEASDVFVRNLVTKTTEMVSVRADLLPSLTANGESGQQISVSGNGRYIAFTTYADDVTVDGTKTVCDIIRRDLLTGTDVLVNVPVDVGPNEMEPYQDPSIPLSSRKPIISEDGRYIAFTSTADTLVTNDTNRLRDVFLRDMLLGTTMLISVNLSNTAASYGGDLLTMSPDGRYVVFTSRSQDVTTNNAFGGDLVYIRDTHLLSTIRLVFEELGDSRSLPILWNGASILTRPLYSETTFGIWNPSSGLRMLNGKWLASSLVAITPDGQFVAVRDIVNRSLILLDTLGGTSNVVGRLSNTGVNPSQFRCQFSRDGRYLVYPGVAEGVDPWTTANIYSYDFVTSSNTLVSAPYAGGDASHRRSDSPTISPDGRFICYRSREHDIVPGVTNGGILLYLYDRNTGLTTVVGPDGSGSPQNGRSVRPVFSGDSRTLAFQSWASDWSAFDFNSLADVFSWKLGAGGPLFVGQLLFVPQTDGDIRLRWAIEDGALYQAEYKDDLSDPEWHPVLNGFTISNGWAEAVDSPQGRHQRFYRIRAH